MSCNCMGTVFSAIKRVFGRGETTPAEEKKSGTLSGRTVSGLQEAPLSPEEAKTEEVVRTALENIRAGKEPGPLTEEQAKKVQERMKALYIMSLADQVARSDATTFEQAEKVATVALDTFAKSYVEGFIQYQGIQASTEQKTELEAKFKEAFGVTSQNIAILGLAMRQYAGANEGKEDKATASKPTVAN